MPQLIDEIYRDRRVRDADGRTFNPFPASIRQGLGQAFHDLIIERHFTRTLEIGLAYGLSALFITQAHHHRDEGSHVAIDPGQERYRDIGKLNLQRAGLADRVEVIEEPSYRALPHLLDEGRRFDFAFIDGNHLFDFTLVDFFYIDLMLDVGGVIVFDDIGMTSCRSAAVFALRNRAYRRLDISTTDGVPLHVRAARVGRKLSKDPFGWRDLSLKLTSEGACFIEKTGDDDRDYTFHRRF